jgi:glycerate-2-kinase
MGSASGPEPRRDAASGGHSAARIARTDQLTGEAREIAAMSAAFLLEVVRNGVSPSDATTIAGAYITAEVNARFIRRHVEGRDGKPPWAS